MIDVKCTLRNKTYRGQDFWKLYCIKCSVRDGAIIKNGMLRCSYLRYYESYKPKRYKYGGQEIIGLEAAIPVPSNLR
jgi:hypothetical protein